MPKIKAAAILDVLENAQGLYRTGLGPSRSLGPSRGVGTRGLCRSLGPEAGSGLVLNMAQHPNIACQSSISRLEPRAQVGSGPQ